MKLRTIVIFIVCGLLVFLLWNYIGSSDYAASAAKPSASPSVPALVDLLGQAATMTAAPTLTKTASPTITSTHTPNAEQTAITDRLNGDSTATEVRRQEIQTADAWNLTATVVDATQQPAMTSTVEALGTAIAQAKETNAMGTQIAETSTPQALEIQRKAAINGALPCLAGLAVFFIVGVGGWLCILLYRYLDAAYRAALAAKAASLAEAEAYKKGINQPASEQQVNQFTRDGADGISAFQQDELLDESEIQKLREAIKKGIPLSIRQLMTAGIFSDGAARKCREKLLFTPLDGGEPYAIEGSNRVINLTATGYQAIGMEPPTPPQPEKSPEKPENTAITHRTTPQLPGEVVAGGGEG
jgi:hypothetical protein